MLNLTGKNAAPKHVRPCAPYTLNTGTLRPWEKDFMIIIIFYYLKLYEIIQQILDYFEPQITTLTGFWDIA